MDLIGIDGGGTWIKAARFSPTLKKQREVRLPSGARQGREEYFDSIAAAVRELGLTPDHLEDEIHAVGLSVPGALSKDRRVIRYTSNIKGLGVTDPPVAIEAALAKRLGTKRLVAENDTGCAGLAEWMQGHGRGSKDTYVLHVTWGTGIGTALVVEGVSQFGWEGGHMPISWTEESPTTCNCGSTRCLEGRVAVPKLIERAQQLLDSGQFTTTLTPEAFTDDRETSKILLQLAEEGDPLASTLFADALRWLARGLHTMAVIAYPDIVTMGGGMMASKWLLTELQAAVKAEAEATSPILVDTLRPASVRQALLGNEAGMVGAAVLAQQYEPTVPTA